MASTKLPLANIESARTPLEKIITTTPVVLTVIATILAGLSSSESSMAQYHRALSAQNESKAADQWAFYQAKRTRQEEADNTRSLLAVAVGSVPAGPEDVAALAKWADGMADKSVARALSKLSAGTDSAEMSRYLSAGLPTVEDQPLGEPGVESAMKVIGENKDASSIVKSLSQAQIDHALQQAQLNANNFDLATKPITDYIDRLSELTEQLSAYAGPNNSQIKSLAGDFTASHLSWDSRRNTAEAKYNQTIAQILEVEVQYTSLDSDRHRDRSKFFFYGMLAAQAGVTISTLSLAVQRRSLLWAAASLVGMGAVAYAAYIYLFM